MTNIATAPKRYGLRARTVFLTSASGAPYDLVAAGDPRTYADLTSARGLRTVASLGIDSIGPDKAGHPVEGRRHAGHAHLAGARRPPRRAHRHAVHVPRREPVPAGRLPTRHEPGRLRAGDRRAGDVPAHRHRRPVHRPDGRRRRGPRRVPAHPLLTHPRRDASSGSPSDLQVNRWAHLGSRWGSAPDRREHFTRRPSRDRPRSAEEEVTGSRRTADGRRGEREARCSRVSVRGAVRDRS
nr:hypothetical protein [Angustibacter aerolatus]